MKSESLVINDICLYLKVFETGSDSSHITGKTLLTSSLIPDDHGSSSSNAQTS